eukprot:jgi/Pico_ML_1/52015/g2793.t1
MAKPTSDEGGMKESEEKNRSKKMPRLELVLLAVALAVALPKVLPFFEKNDHTPVVDKCDCPTHSTPWENYDNGLGLEGNISDCCCDYATVNKLNRDVLNPLLSLIVKQPYFKYFKVNLWCDCPFWEDEGPFRFERITQPQGVDRARDPRADVVGSSPFDDVPQHACTAKRSYLCVWNKSRRKKGSSLVAAAPLQAENTTATSQEKRAEESSDT